MSPERRQEIEQLYKAVMEQEPGRRAAFLKESVPDDELRRELESLMLDPNPGAMVEERPGSEGPLKPGVLVGPYRIVEQLGSGGLGDVYRATDTRLRRSVAIKIIRDQNENWRQRFIHEARAASALNHPNIVTAYDVSSDKGLDFLVMECVKGQTLNRALNGKPMSVGVALGYASQIADALAAAHTAGIIHRDLKPSNIMITSEGLVKILDFGLAKFTIVSAADEPETTRTLMEPTREGLIVGTAAYMSPEQALGQPVDPRSDLFSFGAVLYEMLSGQRAFSSTNTANVLAAIVHSEPLPIRSVAPDTPPALERLLNKCLVKSPDRRWQTAIDLKDELDWIAKDRHSPPAQGIAGSKRSRSWLMIAVAAVLFLAAALWWNWPKAEQFDVELAILPPPDATFHWLQPGAISPDGRTFAFVAESRNKSHLWVRRLDSSSSKPLQGTEGASAPFWSPDGRFLAFFADRKLKKVSIAGGSPQVLCDAAAGRGGAWSPHGIIVFAPQILGALFRVDDSGGEPVPLTKFDRSREQNSHYWPQFLSDGRRFIYFARSARPELSSLQVGSVDVAPDSQPSTRFVHTVTNGAYAPGSGGRSPQLLFVRGETLLSQKFDESTLKVQGDPVPIAEGVGSNAFLGLADFSVSRNNVLVYGGGTNLMSQLVWRNRDGSLAGTLEAPASYLAPKLSPDGRKLAVSRGDLTTGNADIWTMDNSRLTASRLTFNPDLEMHAVWSSDGKQVLFSSNRAGAFNIFQKEATGGGPEQQLTKTESNQFVDDWSPDGRFVLYVQRGAHTTANLWVLRVDKPEEPFPLARTGASERNGQFSPNGRWVAYDSNDTGSYEVYVQSFSGQGEPGARWQVSRGGGSQPRWRRDGKELFYVSQDSTLMAVPIENATSTFAAGTPQALFSAPLLTINDFSFFYDATPDGKRFLLVSPNEQGRSRPVYVLTNWQSRLK